MDGSNGSEEMQEKNMAFHVDTVWSEDALDYLHDIEFRVQHGQWRDIQPFISDDALEARVFTEGAVECMVKSFDFTEEMWEKCLELLRVNDAELHIMRRRYEDSRVLTPTPLSEALSIWLIDRTYTRSSMLFMISHNYVKIRSLMEHIPGMIFSGKIDLLQKVELLELCLTEVDINYQEECKRGSILYNYLTSISFHVTPIQNHEIANTYTIEEAMSEPFLHHHSEFLRILLEKGADPLLENKYGQSAWGYLLSVLEWYSEEKLQKGGGFSFRREGMWKRMWGMRMKEIMEPFV